VWEHLARSLPAILEPWALALVLNALGAARTLMAEVEPGRTAFEEALRLASQTGDVWQVGLVQFNLGRLAFLRDEDNLTHGYLSEAVPSRCFAGWGAGIDPADARIHGIHAVLCKPVRLVDLQTILAAPPESHPLLLVHQSQTYGFRSSLRAVTHIELLQ
jgi:hypothetical protein